MPVHQINSLRMKEGGSVINPVQHHEACPIAVTYQIILVAMYTTAVNLWCILRPVSRRFIKVLPLSGAGLFRANSSFPACFCERFNFKLFIQGHDQLIMQCSWRSTLAPITLAWHVLLRRFRAFADRFFALRQAGCVLYTGQKTLAEDKYDFFS